MYLEINRIKIKLIIAKSFYIRLKGFMFKKDINFALLFPRCNMIHTMFMKKNINIIGINKDNKIIFIRKNVSKNKLIKIKTHIKDTSIIEVPTFFNNFNLNDQVKIIY